MLTVYVYSRTFQWSHTITVDGPLWNLQNTLTGIKWTRRQSAEQPRAWYVCWLKERGCKRMTKGQRTRSVPFPIKIQPSLFFYFGYSLFHANEGDISYVSAQHRTVTSSLHFVLLRSYPSLIVLRLFRTLIVALPHIDSFPLYTSREGKNGLN